MWSLEPEQVKRSKTLRILQLRYEDRDHEELDLNKTWKLAECDIPFREDGWRGEGAVALTRLCKGDWSLAAVPVDVNTSASVTTSSLGPLARQDAQRRPPLLNPRRKLT
jgi:hypothetical protein